MVNFDEDTIEYVNDCLNQPLNALNEIKSVLRIANNKTIRLRLHRVSVSCNGIIAKIDDLYDELNNIIDYIGKMSDAYNDADNSIKSLFSDTIDSIGDTIGNVANFAIETGIKVGSTVWDAVQTVGATVAVGAQSLVKGIAEFGGALVDAAAVIATGIASTQTLIVDGVTWLGAKGINAVADTNLQGTKMTSEIWQGTMDFVKKQYVDDAFNKLYNDTGYGNWLQEHSAIAVDGTVSNVLSGVGYVAGIVALTILTAGVGTAATGAVETTTAGSSILSAVASNAGRQALIAGAAGLGAGTEDAWNDGASLGSGLAYGVANAGWEGLQYYVGGKISGFGQGVASEVTGGIEKLLGAGTGSKLANSVIRVGADSIDGGIEGLVQPALKAIYSDESYNELFKENGGWSSVLTNALVGGGSSILGESIDLVQRSDNVRLQQQISNNIDKENILVGSIQNNSNSSGLFDRLKKFVSKNDSNLASSEVLKQHMDYMDLLKGKAKQLDSELSSAEKDLFKLQVQLDNILNNDNTLPEAIEYTAKKYNLYDFNNYNPVSYLEFEQQMLAKISAGDYKIITRDNNYRTYVTDYMSKVNDYDLKIHQLQDYINNLSTDINNHNIEISKYNNKYIKPHIDAIIKSKNSQLLFNNLESKLDALDYNNKSYGVDQGVSKKSIQYERDSYGTIRKYVSENYMNVKNNLMERYGMASIDASRLISGFDNTGACTYASLAGEIFASYIDNPDKFKYDFGFPMYTYINGQKTLNSLELLTDMYLFANHVDNGGNLFKTVDGKVMVTYDGISSQLDPLGRQIFDADKQKYLASSNGRTDGLIDRYLKSKNSDLNYKSEILLNSFDKTITLGNDEINYLKQLIGEYAIDGYQMEMSFFTLQGEIKMKNLSGGKDMSTVTWNEGEGHSVFVTGMNELGLIVSSWGQKYFISFEDLKTGSFIINASKISSS